MRGRTRLLARTDRLVRLQDTQCYSSLVPTTPVPTRVRGSQGGPRSPEYCTRHICPLPDRFTLMWVLCGTPQMEHHTEQDTWMIGRSRKGTQFFTHVSARGEGFSGVPNSSACETEALSSSPCHSPYQFG